MFIFNYLYLGRSYNVNLAYAILDVDRKVYCWTPSSRLN